MVNLNSPFITIGVGCPHCGKQSKVTLTGQQLLEAARANGYDMGLLNSILRKHNVPINPEKPLSLRDRLARAGRK